MLQKGQIADVERVMLLEDLVALNQVSPIGMVAANIIVAASVTAHGPVPQSRQKTCVNKTTSADHAGRETSYVSQIDHSSSQRIVTSTVVSVHVMEGGIVLKNKRKISVTPIPTQVAIFVK